ncbi:MAG: Ig-like domain-containing protein [Nocardioidaceae bacterium]
MAKDNSFASPLIDATVDQTSYTDPSGTYPDGPLFWRVRAIDANLYPLPWSDTMQLVKRSTLPTTTFPATGAKVATGQHFAWNPMSGLSYYVIQVYKNNDRTFSAQNLLVQSTSLQSSWSASTPLPAATRAYLWRVRKVDSAGNPSRWSPATTFYVTGSAPTLVAPANNRLVSPRSTVFTWRPVSGAAHYRFERRLRGATYPSETIYTTATSWAPYYQLPDGQQQWRVVSLDAVGTPIASTAWRNYWVDATAPMVSSVTPVYTARPAANFRATLTERVFSVNTGTVMLMLKGRQHPQPARVTLSNNGRSITVNPRANMRKGRTYTVILSGRIHDRAGNHLARYRWSIVVS